MAFHVKAKEESSFNQSHLCCFPTRLGFASLVLNKYCVGDDANQTEYPEARASGPSVILILWNNQYGVLADDDVDDTWTALVHAQEQPQQPHYDLAVVANPLDSGCLASRVPGWTQGRVCNSDDPPEHVGVLCQPSEFPQHVEVRIKCQDWESVTFSSWVLQIVLSELLQVPTTLETGDPTAVMQLYNADDRFEFGTSANNFAAFTNAASVGGDCRKLQQQRQTAQGEEYLNCAQVIPEVWTARSNTVQGMIREGLLDPPTALGALCVEGLFMPKFTLDTDPSLASWVGLTSNDDSSETIRHKLASMFFRPTRWGLYCREHSPTRCEVPDGVANRAPVNEWEETNLFSEGNFIGYFRNATQNDCATFPSNCTGHVGDFPCGWGGTLEATMHHLNIALESNGDEPYSSGWTYSQLGQMWRAANATRNHVAMMWAIPDPIYESFVGTDFEFVKVTLPAPTQSCLNNRIVAEDRCLPDPALRLGTALGVCDENARPLHKLILSELATLTKGEDIPEAIQSPAHDVLSQFTVTELQINEMFRYWQTMGSPREAICQWVVDNLEDIQQQYIPPTFPRTFGSGEDDSLSPLTYFTVILGGLAFLLVIGTAFKVYIQRKRRVFRYAQVEFLYLLLAGAALVAAGAILKGLENPTDATCVTQIWFTSLGYTLELVPLLVKVAAINRLMQAASRMRRVELKRSSLRGGVALISLFVALALTAWTIFDPPQRQAEYKLTDRVTEDPYAATIIQIEYFCESDSEFWDYIAVIWNVVLILCATALAFQSRTVKQDFNESQVLSKLIYSHFLFCLLRVMSFFFPTEVADDMLSIIFSLDTIMVVLIYFLPKFLADDQAGVIGGRTSTRISGLNFASASHPELAALAASFTQQRIVDRSCRFSSDETEVTSHRQPRVSFVKREAANSSSSCSGQPLSPCQWETCPDQEEATTASSNNKGAEPDKICLDEEEDLQALAKRLNERLHHRDLDDHDATVSPTHSGDLSAA